MRVWRRLPIDQRATTWEAQTELADLAQWKHVSWEFNSSKHYQLSTFKNEARHAEATPRQRLIGALGARAEI